jgi:hypothetical protein
MPKLQTIFICDFDKVKITTEQAVKATTGWTLAQTGKKIANYGVYADYVDAVHRMQEIVNDSILSTEKAILKAQIELDKRKELLSELLKSKP